MQIQISPAILAELQRSVGDVDRMLVAEAVNNAHERTEARSWANDAARLARYAERRRGLFALRTRLQTAYIAITNDDPWADIAF